ncbi:MAG: redoxin domain-containing protein [Chloroflexota bacterium]|nr:MAG: redoxin domain-containing protein [Chloroflexota bacterium]
MPRTPNQFRPGTSVESLTTASVERTSYQRSPRRWSGLLQFVIIPVFVALAISAVIYFVEVRPRGDTASTESRLAASVVGAEEGSSLRIGDPAPDFTLVDLAGNPIRLSDFRGQAVFLYFFATWCSACRSTLPDVAATYEENKARGAVVLAVALWDDLTAVREYAASARLTFPIVLDTTGQVSALYRFSGLPREAHEHAGVPSFFVDRDGIIRDMYFGKMNRSLMQSRLQKAMQR